MLRYEWKCEKMEVVVLSPLTFSQANVDGDEIVFIPLDVEFVCHPYKIHTV